MTSFLGIDYLEPIVTKEDMDNLCKQIYPQLMADMTRYFRHHYCPRCNCHYLVEYRTARAARLARHTEGRCPGCSTEGEELGGDNG